MKIAFVRRLLVLASVGAAMLSVAAAGAERMQVVKYGESVFVRSGFSAREDLVVRVGKGSSRWDDAAGNPFYLIKIVDKDRLWFLSENAGQGAVWKFRTSITGPRLTCARLDIVEDYDIINPASVLRDAEKR